MYIFMLRDFGASMQKQMHGRCKVGRLTVGGRRYVSDVAAAEVQRGRRLPERSSYRKQAVRMPVAVRPTTISRAASGCAAAAHYICVHSAHRLHMCCRPAARRSLAMDSLR